jgi:hypothetical protein
LVVAAHLLQLSLPHHLLAAHPLQPSLLHRLPAAHLRKPSLPQDLRKPHLIKTILLHHVRAIYLRLVVHPHPLRHSYQGTCSTLVALLMDQYRLCLMVVAPKSFRSNAADSATPKCKEHKRARVGTILRGVPALRFATATGWMLACRPPSPHQSTHLPASRLALKALLRMLTMLNGRDVRF